MLVAGKPLIVQGMLIAPPEPVYPAMVTVLLVITYLNWAYIASGRATISRSKVHGAQMRPAMLGGRV